MNEGTGNKSLSGSTPSSRFASGSDFSKLTKNGSEKGLTEKLRQKSGRDIKGHISVRHQGGGKKKNLRKIDWQRDKIDVKAKVAGIEYDPNRSARIALLHYEDGEKRYILAPDGLKMGDEIVRSDKAEIKIGNALALKNIPVGTSIHNIELQPGRGAQIVRSAGTTAVLLAKEGEYAQVKLPSIEIRLIPVMSIATIGQVSNIDWKNIVFGKAGRRRHMGIRPTVRGTAQNPRSHPHGGGEGRSGEGMKFAKTPWGKNTRGKKTRNKKKYSNKFIVQGRKRHG